MEPIIALLKQNARMSDKDIAAAAGMTEEEVRAKIKEYTDNGIIKGFTVIANEDVLEKDLVTAFIEVKVTPKADFGFDDLAKTIMMYEEVDSITLMSGSFDLAVTLSGTNYKEVALFVAQRLSTIEGVLSTSTHFVLKRYKQNGFFLDDENSDERSLVAP